MEQVYKNTVKEFKLIMISKIIFVQKVAPNGKELISSSDDDDNQFKK